jgi:hypothetical protein
VYRKLKTAMRSDASCPRRYNGASVSRGRASGSKGPCSVTLWLSATDGRRQIHNAGRRGLHVLMADFNNTVSTVEVM